MSTEYVRVKRSSLEAIADAIRLKALDIVISTSPNERPCDSLLPMGQDKYLVFPDDFISNINTYMSGLVFDGENATIVLTDIERMIDESGLIEDTEIDVGGLGGGTITV